MHGKICICKPIGEYVPWRSPAARSAFREKYLVAEGLLDAQKNSHMFSGREFGPLRPYTARNNQVYISLSLAKVSS